MSDTISLQTTDSKSLMVEEIEDIDLDEETKELFTNSIFKSKIFSIISALKNHDTKILKELVIQEHGLLTDHLRRKIWPILLNLNYYETSPRPTDKDIENHPNYSLVVMDVQRSLKRFPPSINESKKTSMLDELVRLIMRILIKNPKLNYYQGFHDICITFLLVLGEEHAFIAIEKLSKTHFKIFLEDTMEKTVDMLSNIYLIIQKENKALYNYLLESDVGVLFGLSWLITWYGHVLTKYEDVVRLFDLFLVSHYTFPLYIITSSVLENASDILQEECNMACVHALLSNIPYKIDIESQITKAEELFKTYPPDYLKKLQACVHKETGKKFSHRWYSPRKVQVNKMSKILNHLTNFLPNSRWTLTISITITIAAVVYMYHIN